MKAFTNSASNRSRIVQELLGALVKLHDRLLLFVRFDGAVPYSADLVDRFDPGDLPRLHQVAGQHGPRSAMTVHAVHGHALATNDSNSVYLLRCSAAHALD